MKPIRYLQTAARSGRWSKIKNSLPLSHFLTDSHGRMHNYLRISITERCNLRCLYCMPEEGVPLQPTSHLLTRGEIKQLARIFVAQGVNKIRLTGGEPTIRKDIVGIVQDLKSLGIDELAITSNGIALHRKLPELVESGVTALNLSLDTLQNEKFMMITRRNGLNSVMKSLERAMELGVKVKLNCVVIKGINDDEILRFVGLAQHWAIEVRFIEYMPFDGNKWDFAKVIPFSEMKQIIKAKYPSIFQRSHKRGETAKVYTCPDWQGSIGFITSMTDDFCGDCNRLRLTSDGNLKVCLFGNEEVSLRDMLRSNQSEDEIVQVIGRAVKNKKEKHAGLKELKEMKNRPMTLIGDMMFQSGQKTGLRYYSTKPKFTHLNKQGEVHMVDITEKKVSSRMAIAEGFIQFSNEIPIQQVISNSNKKGDVISLTRISALSAVKKTSDLIILCHPLPLTKASVFVEIISPIRLRVECQVKCEGKTGVEMEALTGATIGLLNVYDMCKAVDKEMSIECVQVVEKTGGRNDYGSKVL